MDFIGVQVCMSQDVLIQPLCYGKEFCWNSCLQGKCFLIACLSCYLLLFPALSNIFGTFVESLKFFLSLGPTITGILPYAGLKFYMYEKLKLHVPEEHQKSILMRLSCGALAGLFGQTLTYPLDVVKRQMQVFQCTTLCLSKISFVLSFFLSFFSVCVCVCFGVYNFFLSRYKVGS